MDPITLRVAAYAAKGLAELFKDDPDFWLKWPLDLLIQRSYEHGSLYLKYHIGCSYLYGYHGVTDVDEGIKWLEASVEDKYGDPIVTLRKYYYINGDLTKSRKWHLIFTNTSIFDNSDHFIEKNNSYNYDNTIDYNGPINYDSMTSSQLYESEKQFEQWKASRPNWPWRNATRELTTKVIAVIIYIIVAIVGISFFVSCYDSAKRTINIISR